VFALLAMVTAGAFAGVLGNGWILLDDPLYVYQNPHVDRGWTLAGVRWFLHEPHGGNWHPLTSYSHMLDVQLFGVRPAAHHAVSLALHVVNALLLLLVLDRLTGAWWRSVLVAALFALHPLRVESVAWVSERKDVLSALFFLLTIEAYRRWVVRPGAGRFAVVVATTVLGLMSKPMLVTLPIVLVLLDVWPLGRLAGGPPSARVRAGAPPLPLAALIVEKWPRLLVAMASAGVTLLVQHQSGAVVSVGEISPERRLCNALISCWRYVGLVLWPTGLAPFYPNNRPANVPGAVLAALGLAAVTWLVFRRARRDPHGLVGWFWYLAMLVPVIGLIQVGGQAYADRYTYLPVIGLTIALVWSAGDVARRSRPVAGAIAVGALVSLAALSVATARQVARWKDTRTLFSHALAVTRDNPVAHQCLGDVYLLERGDAKAALPHYAEAARLAPGFRDAHNKLGCALGALGRYDEAIAEFDAALRRWETAEIRHNRGFAYEKQGRLEAAVREYRRALELDPDHVPALVHLGAALGAQGRMADAENHLRRALRLSPADADAHRQLAAVLTRQGRIEDAVEQFHEILTAEPRDLDALVNVAWIRATHASASHRDGAEAVRLAERARDASPEPIAVVYSTLAAAYAEAGRFPEAVTAAERAVALARDQPRLAQQVAEQLAGYRQGRPFHFTR
jgi:tetratricopeptide (TPR) repeat protein